MSRVRSIPRVLSIAGTDPTGGAGIHADLKSISANGGYGMAVVTALVAQNTHGVRSVHTPPPSFLREQLDAVSDDVGIDAVKIGMLGDRGVIEVVRDWLRRTDTGPVVLDPVMVATSGDRLLDPAAEEALRALLPLVDLVTPNLAELAALTGEPVAPTWADALRQGERLSRESGVVVLVKGGHLHGTSSPDALVDASAADPVTEIPGYRVETTNTHGTGCSLSSAIATLGATDREWASALVRAKAWLTTALRRSSELHVGGGNGPIHHFATMWDDGLPADPRSITGSWWDDIADIRSRIDTSPFVEGLGDGTLDTASFENYLRQDALYLREYSRVLARASALAPTSAEQVFWADAASGAIAAEMELHRTWLGTAGDATTFDDAGDDVLASPTTAAYLGHLHAAGSVGDYGVVIAAVLPCFWIYQDIGERLAERSHAEHPFAAWLDTYADPAFAASTARAIELVGAAAAAAGLDRRERMRRAFVLSSSHEEAFFAQ